MTTRRVYTVLHADVREAQEAAKREARREGYRVRTVARITPEPVSGYRVELAVDEPTEDVGGSLPAGQGGGGVEALSDDSPARSTSWVREARAEALAWRKDHVAKGGT